MVLVCYRSCASRCALAFDALTFSHPLGFLHPLRSRLRSSSVMSSVARCVTTAASGLGAAVIARRTCEIVSSASHRSERCLSAARTSAGDLRVPSALICATPTAATKASKSDMHQQERPRPTQAPARGLAPFVFAFFATHSSLGTTLPMKLGPTISLFGWQWLSRKGNVAHEAWPPVLWRPLQS